MMDVRNAKMLDLLRAASFVAEVLARVQRSAQGPGVDTAEPHFAEALTKLVDSLNECLLLQGERWVGVRWPTIAELLRRGAYVGATDVRDGFWLEAAVPGTGIPGTGIPGPMNRRITGTSATLDQLEVDIYPLRDAILRTLAER